MKTEPEGAEQLDPREFASRHATGLLIAALWLALPLRAVGMALEVALISWLGDMSFAALTIWSALGYAERVKRRLWCRKSQS